MSNARNLSNFRPSASGQVEAGDIADDAVGIAQLSATGTPSSSTFLRGDNSWQSVPSPTPGGSNTYVQYNNSGSFGGDSGFVYTSGNVGIGTSAPSGRNVGNRVLQVASSTETELKVSTSGNAHTWFAMQPGAGGNNAYISNLDTAGSMIFTVGGYTTERFRFGPSGQLGVAGANYGSSGQVLTSNGSSSAPSWQTVSSSPTTAQVLSATAGAVANDVGSYAFAYDITGTNRSPNFTIAGSSLRFSNANAGSASGMSGTWRLMGCLDTTNPNVSLASVWLRIS